MVRKWQSHNVNLKQLSSRAHNINHFNLLSVLWMIHFYTHIDPSFPSDTLTLHVPQWVHLAHPVNSLESNKAKKPTSEFSISEDGPDNETELEVDIEYYL